MPVRIRLSRMGAKKRPSYKIVIADSRRSRDGKFIERIGTYNPMLQKNNPDRVKIDIERAKYWLGQGAKPSDRVTIFLSNMGVVEKPIITKKTISHISKKERRAKEKESEPKDKKEDAKPVAPEQKESEPKDKKEDAKPVAPEQKESEPKEKENEKK